MPHTYPHNHLIQFQPKSVKSTITPKLVIKCRLRWSTHQHMKINCHIIHNFPENKVRELDILIILS